MEVMAKTNTKKDTIIRFSASKKMNYLQIVLSNKFEKLKLGNRLHTLKWVDKKSHINIAFQLLGLCIYDKTKNTNNMPTCCSLVCSQNSVTKISITIFCSNTNLSETTTREENLGTYDLFDLDDNLLLQKFEHFMSSIAA